MTTIDLAPTVPVLLQFGVLAVGMASWLDDDGSGDSGGEEDDLDVDGEFDDDFDDDFGSFDDMEGGGEGGGGGDASVNELEHRLEELEAEVSEVASKANTVRSENEQISESVEDVEENVRKLLEIYEMVTRGVNPFVDDVSPDAMGAGGDQSFGLFDDEDAEQGDELDEDIANADADEFFDDDTLDEGDDPDGDAGFGELEEDLEEGEFEDEDPGDVDDAETGTDADADDEGNEGGTSFEDLKAEYESGDADWAEGDELSVDASAEVDADGEPGSAEESDLGFDDSDLAASDIERAAAESDFEFQDGVGSETGPGLGLGAGDTPHLAEPPSGYLSDVVCLEWLDHLLSEFGPKTTVRTINYYERIDWIGEPVRDQLFDYLEGLTDSDYLYREEFGSTELTMEDHLRSLDYIEELASEDVERAVVDRCEGLQGNGIQR